MEIKEAINEELETSPRDKKEQQRTKHAGECNNFNINAITDSNVQDTSPSKNDNRSIFSKSPTKGEILHSLHKSIQLKRDEIVQQGEKERESKLINSCTFTPKVSELGKKFPEDETMNRSSYNDYLEKKKKFREISRKSELDQEMKIGMGKIWKKQLTIPENFELKTGTLKKARTISLNTSLVVMHENTIRDFDLKVII